MKQLVTIMLAGLLQLLAATTACAQRSGEEYSGPLGSREGRREMTTTLEFETTTTITVPAIVIESCQAEVAISYYQRNTMARVETLIKNPGCPAAEGTYTLKASLRPDGGDLASIEFSEQWQGGEGAVIEFTRDYPIGDNVRLVSMRTRDLRCTCPGIAESVLP